MWSEMPWPHAVFYSFLGTCYSGNGQFYQGWANVTASGIPCQKWSDQVRIRVRPTEWRAMLCLLKEFPKAGQLSPSGSWPGDRLPSFLSSLVFHTLFLFQSASSPSHGKMCSPSFWQATERLFYLCVSLLLCFANTTRKDYTETLIHFVSSPKAPHWHRRTPQVFPELSDAENYCRNPGGENERPWCYTKDPSVTWEYCSVSPCEDGRQMQCMISATVAVLGHARCLHSEHSRPHRSVLYSVFGQSCVFSDSLSIFTQRMLYAP